MARYRRISSRYGKGIEIGEIYDESHVMNTNGKTVKDSVEDFPEFWELVNDKDEFTLPPYWYVKFNKSQISYMDDYRKTLGFTTKVTGRYLYMSSKGHVSGVRPQFMYKKITLRQFKEHVMKDNKGEIIGYELTEDCLPHHSEYSALKVIAHMGRIHNEMKDPNKEKILETIATNEDVRRHFAEAGVLDKWFKPLYEPKYKLPTVNNYKGQPYPKSGWGYGIVKYGCAYIGVKMLTDVLTYNEAVSKDSVVNRSIKSITLDSGVVINLKQMKQIVEYFENTK